MTADKYKVLLRIAETKSIPQTAAELGYTQASVSHILSMLDDEFHMPLVCPHRGGIILNDAGRRLLPHIRNVVNALEHLHQTAADIRGLKQGLVRVGTFSSVSSAWLPSILKTFALKEPGITIELMDGSYQDIEGWLKDCAVDVAFVSRPQNSTNPEVPLKTDPLMVILPKWHPKARLPAFPLDAFSTEPFISLTASSGQDIQRMIQKQGAQLNIRHATNDHMTLIGMVECGLGISLVPELVLSGQEGRVAAIPLETHETRTISIAMAENPTPAAECFASYASIWVRTNA